MDQDISTSDVGAMSADASVGGPELSVADTFGSLLESPVDQPAEPAQQSAEPPATMTQPSDTEQPAGDDDADLVEFTLDDPLPTIEKLYSEEELHQLAQSNPQAAWDYALQANAYLQQNLTTVQGLTAVAEKVGSVEALQTLGDLGAALFTPGEASPATVYQTLLKLNESYPDPDDGPLNQVARALVSYRAPEMLAEMSDVLPSLLDGTHPYFDLEVYRAENDQVRYQAQKYIDHLQNQRTQILESLAPVIYRHFGNDFALREQYRNVGPEGEYFGLADNTIDKGVRAELREDLRPVYDSLPPTVRGKLNVQRLDEIEDNLEQRKIASEATARLKQIEEQGAEQIRKVNERIEAQQREQAEARAANWEAGVEGYVADRLTKYYKLDSYPASIIQMQLKHFMATDPQAKQVYERAKEAAQKGNQPMLARIEGDLSRHAERAIRQYLGEWQKATGQRLKPTTVAAAKPARQAAPLYSGAPGVNGTRDDGDSMTVADAFSEAFKNLSPYVNQ